MQDDLLLTQYAQNGSEAAFSQIVARHLPLVYGTCRRELGSESLAEDAAQVVFLLLARNAQKLRERQSLAGWLYQTALFVSKNVRKQEVRRLRKEEAVMQEIIGQQRAPDSEWNSVEPLLNAALSALKPVEREAVLLRFLEGHTLAETGSFLGLTEDATRMRVTRAIEKMRRYLASHGAAVTSVILTALLTSEAARPIPAHAAAAITQGTLQAISTGPTANVLLLSKGVSHTMKIIKIKFAALAVVFLLTGASVPPLVHALGPHKAGVKTVADAAPLTQNVTKTFTLDKDQHVFFSASLPQGESMIIVDSRRADNTAGNLGFSLAFHAGNVAALPNSAKPLGQLQLTNLVGNESRVISRSSLKEPKAFILDFQNPSAPSYYWLTVLPVPPMTNASAASPALAVPLFGTLSPKTILLGETKTGRLEKNGYAYFRIALKAGRYQSLLNFSRVDGKSTNPANVDGDLQIDDEMGLTSFNETGKPIPIGYFKDVNKLHSSQSPDHDTSGFSLERDGVFLVTLANQNSNPTSDDSVPVNFTEQIVPDDSPAPSVKQN